MGWVVYTSPDNNNQHNAQRDNAPQNISRIRDGSTNVMMLAEQAARPQRWILRQQVLPDQVSGTRGMWAGQTSVAWYTYSPDGTLNSNNNKTAGDALSGTVNIDNNQGMYSFHPAGVNLLMCDGSVRMAYPTLSGRTFGQLVTRDDGEVLGPDFDN
ncbi:MAG: DUF1559 domain-containing protein [Pirellulales bacterium]